MPKPSSVGLDTTAVIELHNSGLWAQVLGAYRVILTEHIARGESLFYKDRDGDYPTIELGAAVAQNKLTIINVPGVQVVSAMKKLPFEYRQTAGNGEKELLAYAFSTPALAVCSSDHIVAKCMGYWARGDDCLSLEELLRLVSLPTARYKNEPKLAHHTQEVQARWIKEGQRKAITNPV